MSNNPVESIAEGYPKRAMHIAGFLWLLFMAGCVGAERTPPPVGESPAVAIESSMTHPIDPNVAKVELPATKTPTETPVEPLGKKPSIRPSPAKPESAPPLDLTALETRLKQTKAIGVFTKITLKNQVDDLLNQFRAYYQGRAKTTLKELRQPYESLILKVLALLQDGDPELARAIVTSREAIWGLLADPAKFATL